jgi:hypothetical protein
MALQPNSGPGLPLWGFVTITFLQGWIVNQVPNPQPGGQGSVFMTPRDRVAQLYPQALGTHFSHLLWHAWVTVELFFNPGHHTGQNINIVYRFSKVHYVQIQNYVPSTGYGLTETSPLVSVLQRGSTNLSSSGVLIPNTRVKIVNMDTGVSVGPGVVGELCVAGPQVRILCVWFHTEPLVLVSF